MVDITILGKPTLDLGNDVLNSGMVLISAGRNNRINYKYIYLLLHIFLTK